MNWTILIWALLYFIIGGFFVRELDSYDGGDGGLGSYIVFLIWPFIALLWISVMVMVVIPEWIFTWFRNRRDK